MVSERYLGTAADIEAMLDARESATLPERTRHLAFGDVAAAWGILQDLGVAGIIDAEADPRRPGQPLSAGTYLALAALNRVVAPCSKAGFAEWWKTTTGGRLKARRMTTELVSDQPALHDIFGLQRWAPAALGRTRKQAPANH